MKILKTVGIIALGFALFQIGKYFYMQPKVVNGEATPKVKATLVSGESFDLNELKGKYVLVDFWGSWCGPCLKEIPALKQIHQKYENASFQEADGLTIVSVAIERDENRWKRAIDRYDLNWKHHIADLTTSYKFINSPIASEFGVKQVPSKFLLNENGVIIGVNQSMKDLDTFLEKRLK